MDSTEERQRVEYWRVLLSSRSSQHLFPPEPVAHRQLGPVGHLRLLLHRAVRPSRAIRQRAAHNQQKKRLKID